MDRAETGQWVLDRQRRALWAAAFAGGPGELLDFLVPLWAGAVLGARGKWGCWWR